MAICDASHLGQAIVDLDLKKGEILGTQDPNIFEVKFFEDANLTQPIANPNKFNLNVPKKTIHFLIQNKNSTNCQVQSSFEIELHNQPIVVMPTAYTLCDDLLSGSDVDGFSFFDLKTKDQEILDTLSLVNYEVSYHLTKNSATNNTSPLDKTVSFKNSIANQQILYVRVENKLSAACFDDSQTLKLIVHPKPIIQNIITLKQCDNDGDGITTFNLHQGDRLLSSNWLNEKFSYFETKIDAEANNNSIANPTKYINKIATSDTVWVRVETNFGCFRVGQVNLLVSTTQLNPKFQLAFEACDDFLDKTGNNSVDNDDTDGITTFDFSGATAQVLAQFTATGQKLTVTYYESYSDALAELNAIPDPSNHRNINSPHKQTIYVRVDSDVDNQCLGLGEHITLEVIPIPRARKPQDLRLCDNDDDGDAYNGFVQSFDLKSLDNFILDGQSSSQNRVTYHLSPSDAEANSAALSSPFTNTQTPSQTIFARVTHNATACYNAHISFQVVVENIPAINPVGNFELCDDQTDGDATNGLIQNIDLKQMDKTILDGRSALDFSIQYFETLANAQLGTHEIAAPYSNTKAFNQTVFYRIQNLKNSCFATGSFKLIVHPEPQVVLKNDYSLCDDDGDGDDKNGIVQSFDLTSQRPRFLTAGQMPSDYQITFHESLTDAQQALNPLPGIYENTKPHHQTLYVRFESIKTGCANTKATLELAVLKLPEFDLKDQTSLCLNKPETTIRATAAADVYAYEWFDDKNNSLAMVDSLKVTHAGLYTLTATDTLTKCQRSKTITVHLSDAPHLSDDSFEIVEASDSNAIKIITTDLGVGDYEYRLEDALGKLLVDFQDKPLFENLVGGFYVVVVRDKNGCGRLSWEVAVVSFPKHFTPNGDGYHDRWDPLGISRKNYRKAKIYIFNRQGQLLKELTPGSGGWDGTYIGRPLPSDDYWFRATWVDRKGIKRVYKSHFTLKR